MADNDLHLKGFSLVSANMRVNVNPKRLNENLYRAQFALDTQIMNDMIPYMPMNTGTLIQVTRAKSAATAGTGMVCAAAAPYGRFQYYGKVMVDPQTNSPWSRKGAKKIVTDRPLDYSNPKAQPEWFQVAKDKNLNKWVQKVKNKVGGR